MSRRKSGRGGARGGARGGGTVSRWRGSARQAHGAGGCGDEHGPEPCEPRTWEALEGFRRRCPQISGRDLYRTLAYEAWRRWRGLPAPPPEAPIQVDAAAVREMKEITGDLLAFHALAAVEGGALGGPSADLAAWALGRVGVVGSDLYSRDPARRGVQDARLDELVEGLWKLPCEQCGRPALGEEAGRG